MLSLARPDLIFLDRDLLLVYLPNKSFWAESLRAFSRIPEWNPHIFSGTPFWAEMNLAVLNPLNLIFLAIPQERHALALKLFVLGHYPCIAGAAFYFFRAYGRALPSLLLATFFCWSGVVASLFNLPHMLMGMVGTLIFLGSWVRWERNAHPKYFFGAGVGLALCVYGGDPQFVYISFLVLIFSAVLAKKRRRRLGFTACLGVLVFLLSAAQLLPTLSFLPDSSRAVGKVAQEKAMRFSLHPARLAELVVPNYFGEHGPTEELLNGFDRPFLASIYIGALPILALLSLLILRLRRWWKKKRLGPRDRGSLAIWAGAGSALWLSMGVFAPLPLYSFFHHYFPLWNLFRYPERLFLWFFLALLSVAARDLPLLWPRSMGRRRIVVLLALVSLLPLLRNAQSVLEEQPAELLNPEHYPHIAALQKAVAAKNTRAGEAFRFANAGLPLLEQQRLARLSLNRNGQSLVVAVDSLHSNVAGLYGLHDVGGYLTLSSRDKESIAGWMRPGERIFDLFAAPFRLRRRMDGGVAVEASGTTAPYFFLPASVRVAEGQRAAVEAALEPSFDLRRSVQLENAAPNFSNEGLEIALVRREPDRFYFNARVTSQNTGAFFLALNESYDKYWVLKNNGAEIAPLRQNGWALGFLVPRGSSGVQEFSVEYRNPWVAIGSWISLLTMLVALGFFLRRESSLRRERR